MSVFDKLPDISVLVDEFKADFKNQDIRSYASSTAYCMLLSAVPLLIIFSAILPHTPLTEADLVWFLQMVFPDISEGLIRGVCSEAYRVSGGVLPLGIVFMLWSAGFGMMQFTKGLNDVNGVREERNYFLLRLMGTLYALLLIGLLVAVLFLQVFMQGISGVWEFVLPDVPEPYFFTSAVRYVVLMGVAFLVLLLIYTTVPAVPKDPLQQIPGVVATLVGWGGLNALLTLYVNHSDGLNAYYGSLATAVILVLWIYWTLYIMMFGAFANRYVELHLVPRLFPSEDLAGEAGPDGPRAAGEAGPDGPQAGDPDGAREAGPDGPRALQPQAAGARGADEAGVGSANPQAGRRA